MEKVHDLRHQIGLVREALRSEKRFLGFFLGAGCPLGIFNPEETSSMKHIPDVAGLTDAIEEKLNDEMLTMWKKLKASCEVGLSTAVNVEHILTQLRTICALKGDLKIEEMESDDLRKLDKEICKIIAQIVGVSLPSHKNAYHRFSAWAAQMDRIHPLEIFTPNYDLLIEEALEQFKLPYFDGFVGSRRPFFDLAAIEQDTMPSRWIKLWKIHGSINWTSEPDGSVYRKGIPDESDQVMIYPSHLKYDQSRRMPYLAMCDQLKSFFRKTNPVMVLCGYSFADEHLNEMIVDGLRGNRSAHCIALMYSELESHSQALDCAKKVPNLTILGYNGAVIGTREGGYTETDTNLTALGSGVVSEEKSPDVEGNIVFSTKSNLGDFHHFCLFMETQFGIKTEIGADE